MKALFITIFSALFGLAITAPMTLDGLPCNLFPLPKLAEIFLDDDEGTYNAHWCGPPQGCTCLIDGDYDCPH